MVYRRIAERIILLKGVLGKICGILSCTVLQFLKKGALVSLYRSDSQVKPLSAVLALHLTAVAPRSHMKIESEIAVKSNVIFSSLMIDR